MANPSASSDLDGQLLQAHAEGDLRQLVALYTLAANQKETDGDIEATCFFLTHAFIFALESGAPQTRALNRRLVAYGREEPLDG
ncbi:MAG: hypothetical protein ABJH63_13315 [Rhizobiaceae bacterium]